MVFLNQKYKFLFYFVIIIAITCAKKSDDENKPKWTKKKITDYSDADMERLLDQWNEDEEEEDPDDLPEHLRPPATIDMSKVDMSNPESLLKQSKKGKTIMTFVTVSGNPSRDEAEELTKIWQTGLWNNQIQAEKYMIDDNRAIFMYKDGVQAWEAKDFLVEQDRCESVSIENKVYPGKGSPNYKSKDEL